MHHAVKFRLIRAHTVGQGAASLLRLPAALKPVHSLAIFALSSLPDRTCVCRLAEELSTELGAMTERLLRNKEGGHGLAAAAGSEQRQGGAPEEVEG